MHISTRQYAKLLKDWVADVGLDPRAYGTHSVDLHVQLAHLHRVFAFKSDPVPNGKPLVFSVCLLAFYGSKFGATTGSNLDANQHRYAFPITCSCLKDSS
jgi:hypothetical protein